MMHMSKSTIGNEDASLGVRRRWARDIMTSCLEVNQSVRQRRTLHSRVEDVHDERKSRRACDEGHHSGGFHQNAFVFIRSFA